MKRALFALAVAATLSVFAGCQTPRCGDHYCAGCGPQADCGKHMAGGGLLDNMGDHPRMAALRDHYGGGRQPQEYGPPSGAIAYPYYTTRGPRDFLDPNPPSIGR